MDYGYGNRDANNNVIFNLDNRTHYVGNTLHIHVYTSCIESPGYHVGHYVVS